MNRERNDSAKGGDGNAYRILRNLTGKTRERVARETGLTVNDLANAEGGKANFSLEKVAIFASYYGVDPAVLLTNDTASFTGRIPDEEARQRSVESNARSSARSKRVGNKGEILTYRYELRRHLDANSPYVDDIDLSCVDRKRIGYDIFSRELDGTPLLIEVKSTSNEFGSDFHMSHTELRRMLEAIENGEHYCIYRWYRVESLSPALKILKAEEVLKKYDITPQTWRMKWRKRSDRL